MLAASVAAAVGCVCLVLSASGAEVLGRAGAVAGLYEYEPDDADYPDAKESMMAPPSLMEFSPSPAPLIEFYMYRVQSREDYTPENQDMANIGGALWYLQSEIVWHHWIRAGSFSSTPKKKMERFHVKIRATAALYEQGMNFGVVNTFDLGQCSGPFKCENIEVYGPTVGCESWTRPVWYTEGDNSSVGNNFPHGQWVGDNMYPGATWYSLPGACLSRKFWDRDDECDMREPGGACPEGVEPTGARDCTYSYKKIGEVSIDDIEGIDSFNDFIEHGGKEYVRRTDKGVNMDFWDDSSDPEKCQKRIDRVKAVFAAKYRNQPDLPDPECDFDVRLFYPNFPNGTFE